MVVFFIIFSVVINLILHLNIINSDTRFVIILNCIIISTFAITTITNVDQYNLTKRTYDIDDLI